jgi:hypothetical protein
MEEIILTLLQDQALEGGFQNGTTAWEGRLSSLTIT